MRIGIAGFLHESNTFAGEKTTRQHFEEAFLHNGAALIPVWRDAHHELGGFIAGCERAGVELVPLLAASATPKGPVTSECYESIVTELLDRVAAAQPLDGILLALHGAMVSEAYDSADSETLRRVHNACPGVPIVLSLDMHGNVTNDMIEIPLATIAYRTYPHVDQRDRGIECARWLINALRGEVDPVQAHRKLPMLIHIVQQYTGAGPMQEILLETERTCRQDGVIAASVLPGYIYADVPHLGVSVVVCANGDAVLAREETDRLAAFVYERREHLNAALPDIETAVRRAAQTNGTVCLMDSGDNIGGGGPGDSTILYEELIRQNLAPVCVVLYDPGAAKDCADAGEGARVSVDAGGKSGALHGRPVAIQGVVRMVSDGKFVEPEARHGGTRDFDQGLTAVIETDRGDTVVVNSLRVMPTSLQQLVSLGIDPPRYKAIVVKGVTAPRAAYDGIAAATIAVDSPGVTQAGPESFQYRRRPRPLYPLD